MLQARFALLQNILYAIELLQVKGPVQIVYYNAK